MRRPKKLNPADLGIGSPGGMWFHPNCRMPSTSRTASCAERAVANIAGAMILKRAADKPSRSQVGVVTIEWKLGCAVQDWLPSSLRLGSAIPPTPKQ